MHTHNSVFLLSAYVLLVTTSALATRPAGAVERAPKATIVQYCFDGQIYVRNDSPTNKNRKYVDALWGKIVSVDTYRLTRDTAKKKAGDVYLKITGAATPTDRWELSIPAQNNQWSYRSLLGKLLKLVDLRDTSVKLTYEAGTRSEAVFFGIYLDLNESQEVRGQSIFEGVDVLEHTVNTLRQRLGLPPQSDEWMNSQDNSQIGSQVIDCKSSRIED